MIQSIRRFVLGTTLSAAALVGVTAVGHTQGATPIANGHAAVAGIPAGTTSTSFSLVQLQDGSLGGHGISRNSLGGYVHFDITSFVTVGDTLLMAGPITATFDAPPQFIVGGTFILAVQDHGNGDGSPAPDLLANAAAPFPVSAEEVLLLLGPPPPQAFRPVLSGNITIH